MKDLAGGGGARFHDHLSGGNGGLCWAYVRNDDDTVTPYVYDISTRRSDNEYVWDRGGTTYTSGASLGA